MGASAVALVILPLLVSGFLFCLIHRQTRFLTARFDGQRMFFAAAAIGMFFGGLAAALFPVVRRFLVWLLPSDFPRPFGALETAFPIDDPEVWLLSMFLSVLLGFLLNVAYAIH